jgi:Tol biopolymer transport system component
MRRVLIAGTVMMLLVGATPMIHATSHGRNGPIVFASDLGYGFQLYAINDDGTGFHQLTNGDREANLPDWSPDGRRIAFQSYDPTNDTSRIAIINADGSHKRALTSKRFETSPAFTPDGHHIVYECGTCRGGDGVFIMRDDGTHRHRLTTNPFPREGDSDPNVSPDGKTVTFVRRKVDFELQALFAVDINGNNVRKIAPYALEVAIKHDWAPDGRRIVITTDADYPDGRSPNVATIRSDGSDLRMLTDYTGGKQGAFAGSYSPDGRWIVFRVENLERESFRLYKMRPDGSDRTFISRLPFAPRGSDWGSQP